MTKFKLAVIPGDGIGPEVCDEGIKVLNRVSQLDPSLQFQFTYFDWGCQYYLKNGRMMAADGLEQLAKFDAIYLGAVGYPGVPDHISLWDLLLTIRKGFDQYVNLRPVVLLEGAPCPLRGVDKADIQMTFVRENTEGEYAGVGERLYAGTERELALQTGVFSRVGTERVIRYAFELAKSEGKTLTNISKANALNYSMVFWNQIFQEVAADYPTVQTFTYMVDAAAMFMVREPQRFQIVVASNLFGDILTDLGAAIAGGMGLAAGANINPERKYPSMFEPIHGSAPDIAGQGKANPMAAIWTAGQMLTHLGYPQWEQRIVNAIEATLTAGQTLPPDLGGSAHTQAVGQAVADQL